MSPIGLKADCPGRAYCIFLLEVALPRSGRELHAGGSWASSVASWPEATADEVIGLLSALLRSDGAFHRRVNHASEIMLASGGDPRGGTLARGKPPGVEGAVQRRGDMASGIGVGEGDCVADGDFQLRRIEFHSVDLDDVTGSIGGQRKGKHGKCQGNAHVIVPPLVSSSRGQRCSAQGDYYSLTLHMDDLFPILLLGSFWAANFRRRTLVRPFRTYLPHAGRSSVRGGSGLSCAGAHARAGGPAGLASSGSGAINCLCDRCDLGGLIADRFDLPWRSSPSWRRYWFPASSL